MKQIEWKNEKLYLLDQRILPSKESLLECSNYSDVCEAIKTLAVRGAPLIGVAGAFGVVLAGIHNIKSENILEIKENIKKIALTIRETRPTAVNLMWAIDKMIAVLSDDFLTLQDINEALLNKAMEIWDEDIELCSKMGHYGALLIPQNANIITHCNTGSLAASGDGTALAAIRQAHREGKKIHVFVDETRPLLQGARLTAWELSKYGIPYTLITDNMAAHVMKTKKVDLVITGADRIAANGDSANKIGTYGLSVLAKAHSIPFYITAPYSTVDLSLSSGDKIVIEERNPDEVRSLGGVRTAPENCNVYNPAFDVTPSEFITAIITDKGIVKPPYTENLEKTLSGELANVR